MKNNCGFDNPFSKAKLTDKNTEKNTDKFYKQIDSALFVMWLWLGLNIVGISTMIYLQYLN